MNGLRRFPGGTWDECAPCRYERDNPDNSRFEDSCFCCVQAASRDSCVSIVALYLLDTCTSIISSSGAVKIGRHGLQSITVTMPRSGWTSLCRFRSEIDISILDWPNLYFRGITKKGRQNSGGFVFHCSPGGLRVRHGFESAPNPLMLAGGWEGCDPVSTQTRAGRVESSCIGSDGVCD